MTEGRDTSTSDTDRLRPQCFNPKCDESFESVDEMVAVPGRGDRCPRHFCERCSDRIRRGPPLTDGGTERYQHIEIHTCESCSSTFREGHDVVCLSDGYIEIGEEYEVSNRRFFHRECWLNSQYVDTGTDQEGGESDAE